MNPIPIHWRNRKPEVTAQDIELLLQQLNWPDAVSVIQNALSGVTVYFGKDTEQTIISHLETAPYELGGLLLGKVFGLPFAGASKYPWITLVETVLPSEKYQSSSVSLRMGTEVWNRASTYFQSGLMVVGWYHSHPNLGVFFSGTDRATQAAFFRSPYALGFVVDPIRKERKCFFGASSEELDLRAITVF